jgi:hypothetical protein
MCCPVYRYLEDTEPFDRGFYAGPFGWVSGSGAEFAVAIRSAMVPTQAPPAAAAAGDGGSGGSEHAVSDGTCFWHLGSKLSACALCGRTESVCRTQCERILLCACGLLMGPPVMLC